MKSSACILFDPKVLVRVCQFIVAVYQNKVDWTHRLLIERKVISHIIVLNFLFSGHCWVGLSAFDEKRQRINHTTPMNGHSIWESYTCSDYFSPYYKFPNKSGEVKWRQCPKNKKKVSFKWFNILDVLYSTDDVMCQFPKENNEKWTYFIRKPKLRPKKKLHTWILPAVWWKIISIISHAHVSVDVCRFGFLWTSDAILLNSAISIILHHRITIRDIKLYRH